MSTGRANSVVSLVPIASARARAARTRSTRAGRIAKYAQATRGPATARSLSAVGVCKNDDRVRREGDGSERGLRDTEPESSRDPGDPETRSERADELDERRIAIAVAQDHRRGDLDLRVRRRCIDAQVGGVLARSEPRAAASTTPHVGGGRAACRASSADGDGDDDQIQVSDRRERGEDEHARSRRARRTDGTRDRTAEVTDARATPIRRERAASARAESERAARARQQARRRKSERYDERPRPSRTRYLARRNPIADRRGRQQATSTAVATTNEQPTARSSVPTRPA